MFQFIESICFLGGEPQLLDYHQDRVNRTFLHFFSGYKPHDLATLIPSIPYVDRYKCRIEYDAITIDVQFIKYHPKSIDSLKVVDSIVPLNYEYKKSDRSELDEIYQKRGQQDDVIIINSGRVSDSYYANLIFHNGEKWITSNTPLLNGVKRQSLIDLGIVSEHEILKKDLYKFKKVSLINAMLDLEEVVVPVENISF